MARTDVLWWAWTVISSVRGEANKTLRGAWLPRVDSETWEGFVPTPSFIGQFNSWPDSKVPEEIKVWCKGFIPGNGTSEVINGHSVMPIKGPLNTPIPGLLGQCAVIDGRSWDNTMPSYDRPDDSRFWGYLSVEPGNDNHVAADANCGFSDNVCCEKVFSSCWDGSKIGEISCRKHCPDSEMTVERLACWTANQTQNGQRWPPQGKSCGFNADPILAAKVYVKGRGGNPCGSVAGVKAPAASWDVGLAVFPTKRKVTITGYVDDAPSYECYAKAKDDGVWGPSVTLAQIPMSFDQNIAFELMGNSDKPVNEDNKFFDLPLPGSQDKSVLV